MSKEDDEPQNADVTEQDIMEEETHDPSSSSSSSTAVDDNNPDNSSKRDSTKSTGTASTTATTATISSTTTTTSSGSRVGFSNVRVHTHRLSMGDNPGVSDNGIPLTLGWEVEASEMYDVDAFEQQHTDHTLSRYTKKTREAVAAERHSRDSIVKVVEQVQEIKMSRRENEHDNDLRQRRRGTAIVTTKKKQGPFSFFPQWMRK